MRRTSRLTKAVAIHDDIQREHRTNCVRSNPRCGAVRGCSGGRPPDPPIVLLGNALRGFSSADHLTPVCLRTEQTPRPRPPAAPNPQLRTEHSPRVPPASTHLGEWHATCPCPPFSQARASPPPPPPPPPPPRADPHLSQYRPPSSWCGSRRLLRHLRVEDKAVAVSKELGVGHHLPRLVLDQAAQEATVTLALLDDLEWHPAT